ncbi:MAG: hypothetical protein KKE81_00200 [Candidatus Omnitrophica bacterium]|nr:hypothetical protein [Candidatus Omnitrophota bacterium]MBU1809421.1 hypothetical protein [Candidatus Omnitrophota bacterium]
MLRTKIMYFITIMFMILCLFSFGVAGSALAQDASGQDTLAQDAPAQNASAQQELFKQDASAQNASAQQELFKQDAPAQNAPAQEELFKQNASAQNTKEEINIGQPVENKIDLPMVETPEEIYQLKKIDPNRIGAESSYTTFGGFRPIEYVLKNPALGVGQRVEIYAEPKPVDSYIIMAKEMQYVWSDFHGMRQNSVQQTPANYRSIVQPLFVRAYGTEFTLSDPKESASNIKGQIKYTIDYRDVYREYYPKFPDLKDSNWFQQDIMFITTARIEPINWLYISNVGYRYSNIDQKSYDVRWNFGSAQQVRSTYYINQSLAPNPRLEIFGQGEYFKADYPHNDWAYSPDHYLVAGELRLKSKDLKTSYTGRFSYSLDIYSPFNNTFEKYEIWARVGRDFNDRFNAYTMLKYAYGHTRSEDNAWWIRPPGYTGGMPISAPFDVTAIALTFENRAQYRIYDKLWVQGGLDLGTGINMSDFDNVGWLAGLEYYAPGIIRVDVGWRGNQFYNIDDFLTTFYFKCFFFM